MDEEEISETLVSINTLEHSDSMGAGLLERLRIVNQLMQKDTGQGTGARVLYTINDQAGHQNLNERFTVGRSHDCSLRIDDTQLSREHFEITRDQTGCTIRDLNSKNGIKINNEAATEKNLTPGDAISAGKTTFIYLED